MTEHLYQQVARDLGELGYEITGWIHHRNYHHQQATTTPGVTVSSILQTIEADLASAGHALADEAHAILAHHLTIPNMAAYVAQAAKAADTNPLLAAGEKLVGLPPAAVSTVLHVVETLASDVAALGQPAPAAPAAG